jgi:hypothetical protein
VTDILDVQAGQSAAAQRSLTHANDFVLQVMLYAECDVGERARYAILHRLPDTTVVYAAPAGTCATAQRDHTTHVCNNVVTATPIV